MFEFQNLIDLNLILYYHITILEFDLFNSILTFKTDEYISWVPIIRKTQFKMTNFKFKETSLIRPKPSEGCEPLHMNILFL